MVQRGDALTQSGQFADAKGSYIEALNLSPNLSEAQRGISILYERQAGSLIDSGNYSEALRLLKQSLEMYKDNYLAHFQIGRTYSLMKQESKALEAFDAAVNVKPDFALAHYAKGLSLVGLDRIESALEEVSLLKPLDPKLAADLFDFLSKTVLDNKLSTLRQELQAKGTFSVPSQSGSVSMTEMVIFAPLRFGSCQVAWRQSSATIATNYSSSAMLARYTDFELNLKDIDPDRIRSDRSNSRYYLYLPTRNGRTSTKRTNVMWLPNSKGKYDESRSSDDTFSAAIPIKSLDGAEDVISAFKMLRLFVVSWLSNRSLLNGPIVAALMSRPICFPKCGEKLLDEFVLAGLRNDYMNQFQACGGFRKHAS